jgi:hypothetical protein
MILGKSIHNLMVSEPKKIINSEYTEYMVVSNYIFTSINQPQVELLMCFLLHFVEKMLVGTKLYFFLYAEHHTYSCCLIVVR